MKGVCMSDISYYDSYLIPDEETRKHIATSIAYKQFDKILNEETKFMVRKHIGDRIVMLRKWNPQNCDEWAQLYFKSGLKKDKLLQWLKLENQDSFELHYNLDLYRKNEIYKMHGLPFKDLLIMAKKMVDLYAQKGIELSYKNSVSYLFITLIDSAYKGYSRERVARKVLNKKLRKYDLYIRTTGESRDHKYGVDYEVCMMDTNLLICGLQIKGEYLLKRRLIPQPTIKGRYVNASSYLSENQKQYIHDLHVPILYVFVNDSLNSLYKEEELIRFIKQIKDTKLHPKKIQKKFSICEYEVQQGNNKIYQSIQRKGDHNER